MEHVKMKTKDMADENFKKLAALFPNCVTEVIRKDEDGNDVIEHAIDKDKLAAEINGVVVDGPQERYQFNWPGKRDAIRTANAPSTMTLRPCKEESVDFDNTQNLYIEGDNLEVLKLLQNNYLGKVKMIYIDPPYNTGNDFVYNDDFKQDADLFNSTSGMFDENGNMTLQNFEKNSESNGRFHTDWLNMMYPRLKIARNLLKEDGVIFISIDENEAHNLRKVCDEVFGLNNFVSNIIWQSRTSISNDFEVSMNHNQTLIYARDRNQLVFGGDDIDASDYINPDNDPRGPWKLVPLDANHVGGDTVYPVRNPKTGVDYYPPNGRIWCYNRAGMQKLLDDNRIKFGLTDDSSPKRKLFLNERLEKGDKKTPSSVMLDAGTTKDGTVEIMELFEKQKVFDYPKPVCFIERLIKYGAPNGGLVLDFFSGSATTAHACFAYGVNHPETHFLCVQLPENLDETLEKASNDSKKVIDNAIKYLEKLHRPHTICEIGKERIRRAGKKIKDKAGLTAQNLDVGFRVLKLAESNMNDVFYKPGDLEQGFLGQLESNVKADRTDMDLLFQVMLECDLPLSSKIEEKTFQGKKVFFVEGNELVACFADGLTTDAITEIAKTKPYYFITRDSALANDNTADNFEQIWAAYSKDTIRKVL